VSLTDLVRPRSYNIASCMSLLLKARAHCLSATITLVSTTYISFSTQPYSSIALLVHDENSVGLKNFM
jgi:hypothetical protein